MIQVVLMDMVNMLQWSNEPVQVQGTLNNQTLWLVNVVMFGNIAAALIGQIFYSLNLYKATGLLKKKSYEKRKSRSSRIKPCI